MCSPKDRSNGSSLSGPGSGSSPKELSSGSCPHGATCKGGARCQSYAINGCFDKKDPGCPLR